MDFPPRQFFKSEAAMAEERASKQLPTPGPPEPEDPYYSTAEAQAVDSMVAAVDWLRPHYLNDNENMVLSVHMIIVETASGKRIAVDTCIGDNKNLPSHGAFHQKHSSFLDDLRNAGCPPESIDFVLCTHLHFDHVGFNTILQDGQWIPTFPNAKYLFAKKEWNAYQDEMEAGKDYIGSVAVFKDSLQPIVDAGLHELVDSNHVLVDDGSSRVYLRPTEGHTEGHVSVVIESAGESAIITGDCIHHPAQLAYPQLGTFFDSNSAAAADTREALFRDMAEKGIMMIGTHFPAPTAGYLRRDELNSRMAYRFCQSYEAGCSSPNVARNSCTWCTFQLPSCMSPDAAAGGA